MGLDYQQTRAEVASFRLRLRSVEHGWIVGSIVSDSTEVELLLDDVTDPVFELAAWAEAIKGDVAAVLELRHSPWTRFVAAPSGNDRHLQVWEGAKPDLLPLLDLRLPPPVLVGAVRCFLEEIEQHPCLASMWVCFMGLLDTQYDHLADAADELWAQGLREGRWQDDWANQMAFEARYVAAHIELNAEQIAHAEAYRRNIRHWMLRLAADSCCTTGNL